MASQRKIQQLINLTGVKPYGYTIRTSGYDGLDDIVVTNVRIGNALVRALRELATAKPERFPEDVMPLPGKTRKDKTQLSFRWDLSNTPECVLQAMEDEPGDLPDCVAAAWS